VRPRRGKAPEQVDDRRDRLRQDQRHGGSRRYGQSRVRSRHGSVWEDYDSEDSRDFCEPILSNDGRIIMQYSRKAGMDSATRHSRGRSQARRSDSHRWNQSRDGLPAGNGFSNQPRHKSLITDRSMKLIPAASGPDTKLQQLNSQRPQKAALSGTVQHNLVSFYFTNVPDNIPYASLRQGFEVCGIMEDVYWARKRNVNGARFGFVRFSKVKDLDKLLKAVNNVWFGDCKVVAKVSSFDRSGNKREAVREKEVGGNRNEGVTINVEKEEITLEGEQIHEGVKTKHVGLETVLMKKAEVGGSSIGHVVQPKQVYVPKYQSAATDVSWAAKGLVATVLNGDAIPVLQRRIFDAGFANLALIPLGANHVFLKTLDDGDVGKLFSDAAEFFDSFFSKPIPWTKEMVIRERGAWVRIYGVPLHAWNLDSFKLCVLDCGRLLTVDDCTLDRDRLDYARVLVSSSSLEIINKEACVMIDGVLFDILLREEWDTNLGEDACLFDDEVVQDDDYNDGQDMQPEDVRSGEVDALVHHLTEDLELEVSKQNAQQPSPFATTHQHVAKSDFISTVRQQPQSDKGVLKVTTEGECSSSAPPVFSTPSNNVVGSNRPKEHLLIEKQIAKRTASCPPCSVRSSATVPWSLDWVHRHKTTTSGGLLLPKSKVRVPPTSKNASKIKRKIGKGSLRHCAQSLKRIARLPDKDRKEVLRVLQRNKKRGKMVSNAHKGKSNDASSTVGSQSSVNNDWENWLVLHGKGKNKADDVCEIGKIVGLKFKGDKNNMFDVLAATDRKRHGDGGEDE